MLRCASTRAHRRRGRTLLSVASVLLAAALGVVGCGAPRPALSLSTCTVQALSARCGSFSVPENRLTGQGRRISLRVVVVPGTTPSRPDPIVYFAGGPGGAATDEVAAFTEVRAAHDRDLVFVDQRGTGGSHRLACPTGDTAPGAFPRTATLRSCLSGLDADLRFYTTAMAADDVADVLTALHYQRADLYGGSYGVTIAQVFQRRHPGMVRTMTLLSGSLLDVPLFELAAASAQAALDDVFARCASDPRCASAFPHLAEEWRTVLSGLATTPITVPAERSPTGRTVVLTADLFASAVEETLVSADGAAQLPALVHALATSTDPVGVVTLALAQARGSFVGEDSVLAMSYVIRCAEPWARFDPAAVAANGRDSFELGALQAAAEHYREACALLPAPGAAADYGRAEPSDVPVLLINGSADPADPPANVEGADRLWPHSLRLVAPHQGHSVSAPVCQESIVDRFIEQGTVQGLDTGCLDDVRLPGFVVLS